MTGVVARARSAVSALVLLSVLLGASGVHAQSQPGAETPWPHVIDLGGGKRLEIYPPQMDSWDNDLLKARAAVVEREGSATSNDSSGDRGVYGTLGLEAQTLVDKGTRTVELSQLKVTHAEFPSAGDEAQTWVEAIQADFARKSPTLALDRLEAALKIGDVEAGAAKAALRNDPPALLFSEKPALLVSLEGDPHFVAVPGSSLQRVVNTRVLLVKDGNRHYLHVFDGWMTALSLTGPWSVLPNETADLKKLREEAEQNHAADLLTGQTAGTQQRAQGKNPADSKAAQTPPSLKYGTVPEIRIATVPTELIVSNGKWSWTPIQGTKLLYVSNTTGNIFRDTASQDLYVLVSGRWFRSRATAGPWSFVAANALPADFANIPDDSDKENVKASVAGTSQAKEAAIAATVPQTAAVPVSGTKMDAPRFDGDPKWDSIPGTTLSYAANTPTPLVRIDARTYYANQNAIWFTSASVKGPWIVATSVPAVIYTIPPSSPLYYLTFVQVYGSNSSSVTVGYTSGFQGSYIDPATGVVVYGTGYVYTPWVGTTYVATQTTYGYGASVTYTPWTGWAVGFCFGWAWGAATSAWDWGWGPYPYWGPWGWGWGGWWGGVAYGPWGGAMAWGPGGWAGFSGPIYQRWGSLATVSRYSGGFDAWTGNEWAGRSGVAYNSRTGRISAGQRGVVANVYTGNYAMGGRGVTRGPGGVVAGGSHGTAGNAITGNSISGNKGFVYNPATGQGTTYAGIRGDDGGVARIGDDVYAGHDGNVYRKTDDGWQKHTDGGWSPVTPPSDAGNRASNLSGQTRNPEIDRLDRERDARNEGAMRNRALMDSAAGMSRQWGGGRMGGMGGGFHGGRFRR